MVGPVGVGCCDVILVIQFLVVKIWISDCGSVGLVTDGLTISSAFIVPFLPAT